MRLYHLTAQKWAEKIRRERSFNLSTLDELIDPFELFGAPIGERRAGQLFKIAHEHWTRTYPGRVIASLAIVHPISVRDDWCRFYCSI
ncbi:hypothetical protein [Paraburkholderia sp. BCC1885]|uniref:hypothetical protein n=1 Tax=Paraburkholderia sp. BCC1885 TaxID=2562669 RepID=UPI001181DB40|nr:hypothetical protein [Paraburkholderia sp. BCC1885]